MPLPDRPYAPTPEDVTAIQSRLAFGAPWDWTSDLWAGRQLGHSPPTLPPSNPAAWGPWASQSCDVLLPRPEGPATVAVLSRRLVGHPSDPDGLPGPSWAYLLELEPAWFPPPCPTTYSADRDILLETLAYLIASRPSLLS